tara:strand:- start:1103 stop:1279 length:177 start_codon:yes stop_codon:yes gene_type:complete
MDKNSAKSINNITGGLHDDIDSIYEDLMDENFKEASKSLDSMMETIKHLKTNMKIYEV